MEKQNAGKGLASGKMNNATASRVWQALGVRTHTLQLLMSSMPKILWKIITIHHH